jgi:hypothetical protein
VHSVLSKQNIKLLDKKFEEWLVNKKMGTFSIQDPVNEDEIYDVSFYGKSSALLTNLLGAARKNLKLKRVKEDNPVANFFTLKISQEIYKAGLRIIC